RRRHTRFDCDWSSDVCSSDLVHFAICGRFPPPCAQSIPGDVCPTAFCTPVARSVAFCALLVNRWLSVAVWSVGILFQKCLFLWEIGRASCRESVEMWVVVVRF